MMGLAREAVNLKNTRIYFTFRGPCIVIYSYNKSQQDALFLNFIFIYNFTCFGQTYCPSSGDLILYSQQLVFSYYLCWLFASEVEMFWTDLLSIITSLNPGIYSKWYLSYKLCWLSAIKVEMFWTDLPSIIRSLNTVFTASGVCHTSYVDCLLARLRCSGQTYRPSSGVLILYSQQLVFSYYLCWLFASEVEMFWTDLLSIIRSLNTVFTAIDICHTIYVYSLLVRSSSISTSLAVNTVYNIKAFG